MFPSFLFCEKYRIGGEIGKLGTSVNNSHFNFPSFSLVILPPCDITEHSCLAENAERQ